MATKHWFRQNDSIPEQRLVEDLIVEAIQIYGIDVMYVRRKTLNRDNIIVDEKLGSFDAAFPVEMYIKSNEGFEGEGDFLSKFGLEIRDRMVLSVARRSFKTNVTDKSLQTIRPFEGDLIFFPLNRKLFEIKFVEHEAVFYQMGSLQTFDLTCELYEYSNEIFDTGVDVIDDIYKYRMNHSISEIDSSLGTEAGEPLMSELGSLIGSNNNDPETNDPLAINSDVEWEGRKTINWDESDPFSESGKY
jgi:hypothetical protein